MTNKEKFKEVFGLEIDDTSDCGFFDCSDRQCKDCSVKDTKHWWNAEYKEPTTKNNLGVDCISRADAIKAMQDKAKKLTNEDTINGLCGAVAILFDLPSVTPKIEPRKGHWIRVAGGSLIDDYRCDCCNHQPPIRKVGSTWGWDFTDYCPNCGAKMESEE